MRSQETFLTLLHKSRKCGFGKRLVVPKILNFSACETVANTIYYTRVVYPFGTYIGGGFLPSLSHNMHTANLPLPTFELFLVRLACACLRPPNPKTKSEHLPGGRTTNAPNSSLSITKFLWNVADTTNGNVA